MEEAWVERALMLSDLLHTNSTGQTCGYFPVYSLVVIHVEDVQQMNKKHSLQVSNFLFLFLISPSLGTCLQKHAHTAPTVRISCCAENHNEKFIQNAFYFLPNIKRHMMGDYISVVHTTFLRLR